MCGGSDSVQSSHPMGSSVPAGSETRRKARLSFKENSENFPQPQLLFFQEILCFFSEDRKIYFILRLSLNTQRKIVNLFYLIFL